MQNNGTKTDLAQFRPHKTEEIDLGDLIKNIVNQWRLITIITVLGTMCGICVALFMPKLYRVEVIFDKPSNMALAPLLGQPFIDVDRQSIFADFLKNLKSQDLIEDVLEKNKMFVHSSGTLLNEQERFTKIRNLATAIKISPTDYSFLPNSNDTAPEIDQISYSLLTATPNDAQILLNGLLEAAESKTINDLLMDIIGAKEIQKRKLESQLAQIEESAKATKLAHMTELRQALNIAKALNLQDSSAARETSSELFQKGSNVLDAELSALRDSEPTLGSIIIGYDTEGHALTLTAESIFGQLGAINKFTLDSNSITFIPKNTRAKIPADSEKPNRPLIVIAAAVFSALLGTFIALIRVAVYT